MPLPEQLSGLNLTVTWLEWVQLLNHPLGPGEEALPLRHMGSLRRAKHLEK